MNNPDLSNSSSSDDWTLAEPEALSTEPIKLPLPEQDREIAESLIRKGRKRRMTISELMAFIFLLCLLLSMSRWFSFEIYTVGLGCATVCLMLFEKVLTPKYRLVTITTLLLAYIISAAWLIVQG